MNQQLRALLETWYGRSYHAHRSQYHSAAKLRRMHLRLGVPAAILAFLAASGILSSFAVTSDTLIKILSAIISFVSGSLAALQTFLKLDERAESHTVAGARFSSITKEIEELMALPPSDETELRQRLAELRRRWDKVAEESPTAMASVWAELRKETKDPKITEKLPNQPSESTAI